MPVYRPGPHRLRRFPVVPHAGHRGLRWLPGEGLDEPGVTDGLVAVPEVRGAILPDEARPAQEHPDVRLARRARTIAELARVISERKVDEGIRRTLWAQAQRLESLAKTRLDSISEE